MPSSASYLTPGYAHLCTTVCRKVFLAQASLFISMAPACGKPRSRVSFSRFVWLKVKDVLLYILKSQQRFDSIPSLWLIWIQQYSIPSHVSCIWCILNLIDFQVQYSITWVTEFMQNVLTQLVLVFFSSTCFWQLPEHKALGVIGLIIVTLSIPEICLFKIKISTVGFCRHSTDKNWEKNCWTLWIQVVLCKQAQQNLALTETTL